MPRRAHLRSRRHGSPFRIRARSDGRSGVADGEDARVVAHAQRGVGGDGAAVGAGKGKAWPLRERRRLRACRLSFESAIL